MKCKAENVIVVTKCDITINLENEKEILALKNICSMAEDYIFTYKRGQRYEEELQIIKILRDAVNVKEQK
jgi:hypothetical protein